MREYPHINIIYIIYNEETVFPFLINSISKKIFV